DKIFWGVVPTPIAVSPLKKAWNTRQIPRHILFDIRPPVPYPSSPRPSHSATPSPEDWLMNVVLPDRCIVGPAGELLIPAHDELTLRLLMLIEGECEAHDIAATAAKYGFSRQRYYQLLRLFE